MKNVPAFLLLVLFAVLVFGCATRAGSSRPPSAEFKTPGGGSFRQSGGAAVPGNATTTTGRASFTIPVGTPVEITPAGSAQFTAAAPIPFQSAVETFTATGPSAFTPPAPPSPTEEAAGLASLWFRLGLAGGVALGIFGLVKDWDFVAIGGGAVAAACLVALTLAAVPVWVWIVIGVGFAAVIGGPAIWHMRIKHLTPPTTPPPSPSPSG